VDAVDRRPTPFTAIGLTAHRLHEVVASGAFATIPIEGRRGALEATWDAEIEAWNAKMVQAWAPVVPPDPSVWPGIDLTRSRVIRALLRNGSWDAVPHANSARGEPASDGSQRGLPHLPQVELRLEDAGTRIFGILDRLQEDSRGLVVVDVKSGVLQGSATDEQRRQLLLYAGLVRAVCGRLPDALVIQDAAGREHAIAYVAKDVDAVVHEVDAARARLNRAIESRADLRQLAMPEPERCAPCSQRLACVPYWAALSSDWGHGSVFGEVLGVASGAKGTRLAIRVASPLDLAGSTVTVTGVNIGAATGDQAAAVDLELTSSPSVMRARWDSRTRLWSEPARVGAAAVG
jgi:hypothetical protein